MRGASLAVPLAVLLAGVLSACSTDGGRAVTPAGTPGITDAPCPNAVNKGNGCIYLGVLTDQSGIFKTVAGPGLESQRAFWDDVNREGGIAGYDVNIVTYTRDTAYNVDIFEREFKATKDKVFAYAQLLGSAQLARVLPTMKTETIVGAPFSWTSQWAFEDNVVESGASYCFESMNAVDYAVETFPREAKPYPVKSVLTAHYPGDFGGDSERGARASAEHHRLKYDHVALAGGQPAAAIKEIVKRKPSLVMLTVSPADTAAIVLGTSAKGFRGRFIASSPAWSRALLDTKPKFRAIYERSMWMSAPWRPFATDSPGHASMRAAVGTTGQLTADDAYISGWAFSIPLKAALEKTAESGPLTRERLFTTAKSLTRVDYEGILPEDAGDFTGDANKHAFRKSVVSKIEYAQFSRVRVVRDFWAGPTAERFTLSTPCYAAPGT